MCYLIGFSIAEIATVTGVSTKTISRRHVAALAMLRDALGITVHVDNGFRTNP